MYDEQPVIAGFGYTLDNLRKRVVYSSFHQSGGTEPNYAVYYSYDVHGNVKQLIRYDQGLESALGMGYKTVDYGL